MTNVLSMDLGDRFRRLMESGLCAAAASRPLLPSPATAARWGKPESFVSFFVELIGQDPDITLVELQAALLAAHDMRCSTSGIDALLRRHGYI